MRPSSGRCCCPGRFDGVADGGDFAAHGASSGSACTLKLLVRKWLSSGCVGDGCMVDVFTDQGDFVLASKGGALGQRVPSWAPQAEAAFAGREHGGSLGAGAGAGAFAGGVAQEGGAPKDVAYQADAGGAAAGLFALGVGVGLGQDGEVLPAVMVRLSSARMRLADTVVLPPL